MSFSIASLGLEPSQALQTESHCASRGSPS